MIKVHLNNTINSISVSQMLKFISTRRGEVTVPVEGNLNLPHVNGIKTGSQDGISISRALTLNTIIERLTSIQRNTLDNLYEEFKSGNIKHSELINAMREMMKQNETNSYLKTNQNIGLLTNTLV